MIKKKPILLIKLTRLEVLSVLTNETNNKLSPNNLERYELNLYSHIFEFSFKTLQEDDPDIGFQKLLNMLGNLFVAEHCYVYENDPSVAMLENIYEWHSFENDTDSNHLSAAQMYYSPLWSVYLQKGIIFFKDINRIAKLLKSDYKILVSQNINSLIIIKIPLNNCHFVILEIQNPNPMKIYSYVKILKLISSAFILLLEKRDEYIKRHKNVISTMFFDFLEMYSSVHLINLQTDTFSTIKKRNIIYKFANEKINNCFSETFFSVLHKFVNKRYINKMISFTDLNTLPERIKNCHFISQDFLGNYSGWCRAKFIRVNSDRFSSPKQLLFTIEKINSEKNYRDRISYLSTSDDLTGLLTREYGAKSIQNALMYNYSCVFCIFDLNGFKKINDTYGHVTGDCVLKAIADSMLKQFRKDDILVRLGGDEFIIFLSQIPLSTGKTKIENFIRSLSDIQIPGLDVNSITASAGIILIPKYTSTDFETLYHYADKLMYQSKFSLTHDPVCFNYADIRINNNIV